MVYDANDEMKSVIATFINSKETPSSPPSQPGLCPQLRCFATTFRPSPSSSPTSTWPTSWSSAYLSKNIQMPKSQSKWRNTTMNGQRPHSLHCWTGGGCPEEGWHCPSTSPSWAQHQRSAWWRSARTTSKWSLTWKKLSRRRKWLNKITSSWKCRKCRTTWCHCCCTQWTAGTSKKKGRWDCGP